MTQQVTGWRNPSRSAQVPDCVEVGRTADGAAVRETKKRSAGYITVSRSQWTAFLNTIKTNRLND